ncbi:snRNA-activating protein complex subunit 2 isoform X1 [Choloepus didactylus]|uniref:snRNA-activating protein complex subunit 2 isoform X1 n=1 Tax=Choloepus didactylus TaxID=27675 RepID=UPI00189DF2E6|nr:snRNA-activating protein complex subunit 2 isoform X1 [Choloepus didactylus]
MKPPQRRRAAPARYLGEASGPAAWSAREKRQLLRLLQARRGQPEPNAAELSRELPGRSEAEIRDFLQQLKGRVAREAIQRVRPGGPRGPRCQEAQTPAPIEVWMDLAEKITGPLEEAVTAAFSQVFTIAATEPISLLHSKPSKPTQARGKQLLLSTPGEQEAQAPKAPDTSEVPGPAPKSPSTPLAGTSMEGDLTVDFEKIYKYLSSFSRSSPGPELSAAESAVVLDLLLSLPQELTRLPCTDLVEHMAGAYLRLMAPQPSSSSGNLESGAEAGGTGSKGHEQPSQATPQAPDNTRPHELTSAWQAAGVCPLNPFLVPLELLGRAATPAEDTPGRP